ncbi:nicotinamide riboside transporter PnuC [Pontibacter diazotrophicus]|uniref:Nicotinamide riboside transporter PnuC n=1 Tax=Pontibacter diazotrophicus TaxID=1400979 RepID=A0A3D8LCL4_9BACT|nr:nicotinamide riboside transporter PnuC [Pontibacter diazotrophicus]RDV15148.1 nicotinamide riboside transporter PnuC [Pontibacter diazotrophicus]
MNVLQSIVEALQAMNVVELIGVVTGIVCVWLAAKQNIWTWPIGLISVGMYVFVFYDARLYADMGLNAFYFVTSLYGWYMWLYGGKNDSERKVERVSKKEMTVLLALGLVFTLSLGYFLDNYTDADLSYTDSATTAVSLIGYWMMAKKQLENWIVWLVVDVVYVGVYTYKDLYLTSFLYFVFLLLSIKGYIDWKKDLVALKQAPAEANA